MDNVDGSQVSSASPLPSTTPSPTLILLCIVSSAALVSLALLIQSDSPFIRTIQHAGSRLWDPIASHIWQTPSTSPSTASNSNKQQHQHATGHTRSQSQSSSKKGKNVKGGKRKVVIAKDVDMSNVATGSQSRRRAGNSSTGAASSTPSQQSNPSVTTTKPTISKATRQNSTTVSPTRSMSSPKRPFLLPTPATSPITEQPEPISPTRPAAARTLSNTIFHTILNPRAAAYEFRAQYYDLPHDPSTTTDATAVTPIHPDHTNPISTGLLAPPVLAITPGPSDGCTPVETSGAVSPTPAGALQPYDAFLVLDVEATCEAGSRFDHPNEIIVSYPPSL